MSAKNAVVLTDINGNKLVFRGYVIRCCGNWLCPDLSTWTKDKTQAGIFSSIKAEFLQRELVKFGKYTTATLAK